MERPGCFVMEVKCLPVRAADLSKATGPSFLLSMVILKEKNAQVKRERGAENCRSRGKGERSVEYSLGQKKSLLGRLTALGQGDSRDENRMSSPENSIRSIFVPRLMTQPVYW